jgi:hypothetical protein
MDAGNDMEDIIEEVDEGTELRSNTEDIFVSKDSKFLNLEEKSPIFGAKIQLEDSNNMKQKFESNDGPEKSM